MNRFTFASINLVLAAVAACEGKLAVTQTQDEGSGGTAEGGDSGGPADASGGTAARTGSGGRSTGHGGASGGEATGGAANGGSAGSAGGDPATGGAAGGPATDHCSNELHDAGETDIDCGGNECPACGTDAVCVQTSDCESHVCRANRCRAPTCDDKVQNGDETGVDCGGSCIDGPNGYCKVTPTDCSCATSANLLPIACGVTADVAPDGLHRAAHLDGTGNTAALALCQDAGCDAHRWSVDEGLVFLAQTTSVRGISQDGSAVLVTYGPNDGGFLWQTGDIRTELNYELLDLSADGTTVLLGQGSAPARWTAAGGLQSVPWSRHLLSQAVMTPDAAFVAGQRGSDAGDSALLLWNAANEETLLEALPDASAFVEAISADGQVIAGTWPGGAATATHIYRWSAATGLVKLADLPRVVNSTDTYVPHLNADGSVLLGNSKPSSSAPSTAFRWTQTSGVTGFANSPPEGSVLVSASADNGVAIGYTLESAHPPFVWDVVNGVRPLRSVLEDAQIDLEGWELGKALTLSADGKVVLGQGTCGGEPAVFRAVLP